MSNVERMAQEILKYSGDWVPQIPCEFIERVKNKFTGMVVYFGPMEDFEDGEDWAKTNIASKP